MEFEVKGHCGRSGQRNMLVVNRPRTRGRSRRGHARKPAWIAIYAGSLGHAWQRTVGGVMASVS